MKRDMESKLGVWDWNIQTTIYKINKVLLYDTGSYIQNPVIGFSTTEPTRETFTGMRPYSVETASRFELDYWFYSTENTVERSVLTEMKLLLP